MKKHRKVSSYVASENLTPAEVNQSREEKILNNNHSPRRDTAILDSEASKSPDGFRSDLNLLRF